MRESVAVCKLFTITDDMTLPDVRQRAATLRLLWTVCLIAVVVGSLLPAGSAPMRALDKLDINDKVQHLLAYAVLAFLPALHERLRKLAVLLLIAAALGVLLEYGQLYSPGRTFDVHDMLADVLGIALGTAIGLPLRSILTASGTVPARS